MTDTQKEQLLHDIRQLIAGTDFENHVFMVGGAVRDELMGLPVKDLDICVDLPDGGIQLAQFITRQQKTYRKGTHPTLFPAYGIARFHLSGFPETEIECVQTRKERYEHRDSRNPVTTFATLSEDCLRRDLTINALYKNISTGEIIDITGHGLSDLKQHIIRTPREPFITFDEDALRELRCIRFAARFGWQIETNTLQGITDNAERISIITQDRITDEISRMLTGPHPDYALSLLKETGLLAYILPEWQPYVQTSVWDYLLATAKDCEAVLASRLAAILQPFKCEETVAILRRMNYPVDLQKKVKRLCLHLHDLDDYASGKLALTDAALRRLQYEWGDDAQTIINLLKAIWTHRENACPLLIENVAKCCHQMQAEGTDCFHFTLPANGKDIMEALQLKPGPQIKTLMNRALALCFENPTLTKAELIQQIADEYANS